MLSIHASIRFNEAPLYLPEIVSHFPKLSLKPFETDEQDIGSTGVRKTQSDGHTLIEYPMDVKMRPFVRFCIAKAMGEYFLEREGLIQASLLDEHGQQISQVQCNLFAAKLLTPPHSSKKKWKILTYKKTLSVSYQRYSGSQKTL